MIVSATSGGYANCVWHDNDGVPQSASYEFSLFEKVEVPSNFSRKIASPG